VTEYLEDVYGISYRRLVVQLYAVIGDLAEAEDAVQEAFARAMRARSFRRAHNPEAWLRMTALNVQRNRWRKVRNFAAVQPRLLERAHDPPDLGDRVDVIEALRSLPNAQREVVALHHIADLSVGQIAAELSVPIGTVKSRLKRGRDALAVLLAAPEGGVHV
jgi:RNA polymerase sigma-70 factor, ECF subfamily